MLVTLTTDFGLADGYVAAMKGAMLCVDPGLRLVDVSHTVPPQDVMAAAFVLDQAAPHFPDGTVHLCVVDPGVGTARRAIAARARFGERSATFVGPDNGVLSLLLHNAEPEAIVALDRPEVWRSAVPSSTFHGRDIFGPVAARLAAGADLGEVGTAVDAIHRLHWPLPRVDDEGVDGMVLHIDRYGNAVTNIEAEAVEAVAAGRPFKCYVGTAILRGQQTTYASVAVGEPLVLCGSTGHMEVAVHGGHAADLLSIQRGTPVNLVFETAREAARETPPPPVDAPHV